MATRHHLRQSEEKLDDNFEWGSHRGGGGAPLRSSEGQPISKLGTVINGSTIIDADKYNGTNCAPSIRDMIRPSTSYHTPLRNTSNLFDPGQASIPVTPIRPRGHISSHDATGSPSHSHSNVTEVIAHNHNPHKSNRLRVTNLVNEQHCQLPRHNLPLQSPTQEVKPHLGSEHQKSLHRKQSEHSPQPSPISPTTDNSTHTEDLLREMKQLKTVSAKQTMLQSIRWGLDHIDLIEEADYICIGGRGGSVADQRTVACIIKDILIDFMKGRSHNIGIRKILHTSHSTRSEEVGHLEDEFHVVLSEGLHLLCGTEPAIARRGDGDWEISIDSSSYCT